MSLKTIKASALEDWLRHRYFDAKIDISGSGVQDYSLAELVSLTSLTFEDLGALVFHDSPTLGAEPLRAAISDRFDPRRLAEPMVTHGSTEAIFLALVALLSPGEEVVVLSPVYPSLSAVVEAIGAKITVWPLDPAADFAPDLDLLASLLHPGVRAVIVNFPHNPTGASLDDAQLDRLVELVDGVGATLIWDAAFAELTYGTSCRQPEPGSDPRIVVTGSLSKAYGLPGIRIGWCLAPPDLLADMVRIRDYVTLAASPLNEMIATAVLRAADRVVGPRLAKARENRELLRRWAADQPELVSLPVPHGGVSAFPRFTGVADTTDACIRLADEQRVLVVPGACFGHPDRVRIGFGNDSDALAAGLAATAQLMSSIAQNDHTTGTSSC
ncbi:capreomycidine synthase [Jatrophihabitans sp.]|jgi:capreomycidine synthase|uniref:capreomycidine synthase n=1 Tax=Jatrophihabitans sp. TaxID=1932789 RepID=UPI002F184A4F